jgi:LemA protein
MIALWIIIAVVVLMLLWVAGAYNGFIKLQTHSEEAWADIDVQLKRRYDLIPNLVETVKGYAEHEREAFENVTKARAQALSAEQSGDPTKVAAAENMLTSALKSVFALAEAYPDLKASENFKELQTELSDTENKIQAARRFYNGNVRDLNIKIETFPSNVIAGMFRFAKKEFFELDENPEQRENVKVDF